MAKNTPGPRGSCPRVWESARIRRRAQRLDRRAQNVGRIADASRFLWAELEAEDSLDAAPADDRRQAEADVVDAVVVRDQARDGKDRGPIAQDRFRDQIGRA